MDSNKAKEQLKEALKTRMDAGLVIQVRPLSLFGSGLVFSPVSAASSRARAQISFPGPRADLVPSCLPSMTFRNLVSQEKGSFKFSPEGVKHFRESYSIEEEGSGSEEQQEADTVRRRALGL